MRHITLKFGVGGMSCASCVASLEAALRHGGEEVDIAVVAYSLRLRRSTG